MMRFWKHIPPLKSLLALEATARHASFSAAAEELNVSQSAVSHAVTTAETFLGVALIDRGTRPVSLTPAGRDRLTTVQRSFAPAFQRLTADWTPDDLHRILTDLEALSSRLEQVRDTARPPSPSPRA